MLKLRLSSAVTVAAVHFGGISPGALEGTGRQAAESGGAFEGRWARRPAPPPVGAPAHPDPDVGHVTGDGPYGDDSPPHGPSNWSCVSAGRAGPAVPLPPTHPHGAETPQARRRARSSIPAQRRVFRAGIGDWISSADCAVAAELTRMRRRRFWLSLTGAERGISGAGSGRGCVMKVLMSSCTRAIHKSTLLRSLHPSLAHREAKKLLPLLCDLRALLINYGMEACQLSPAGSKDFRKVLPAKVSLF